MLSIGAALWPDRIKQWLGDNVTPEHIRIVAIPCIAIFAVYWLLLLWLKPKPEPRLEAAATQSTSGHGSHAIGSIQTANFNNVKFEPSLRSAAASRTVAILQDIETKYCRGNYLGILKLLGYSETLQNNIIIVVGSNLGSSYVSKDVYEEANDFFEGGGTILKTDMKNFSQGPMRELTLPPGEVVYVNFNKEAGEIMAELSSLALSPFLPNDVKESLVALNAAVSNIYDQMITFLNDRFKKQRVRLIAAVNDPAVFGGLSNEFLEQIIAIDGPISNLRETIERSLSNG